MAAGDGSDGRGDRGGLAGSMPAALALPMAGHLRERGSPFLGLAARLAELEARREASVTTRVFLYGTLMHDAHRAAVLGREVAAEPDVLEGWRRGRAGGDPWPAMTPEPGARTRGVSLEATAADLSRLERYEGAHGYGPRRVETSGGAATTYLPARDVAPGGEWSLGAWAAEWADLAVETAREAMAEEGDLAPRMPSIRRRAMARLAARSHGANRLADVEVLERRRPYSGFYAFEEWDLRHRLFDGGWSEPMTRGVLVSFDAVIVLPYDPARDRVLLVEQLRVGRLARGSRDPWSLEPVAGLLDPGESPEDCARREAREEAGLELGALHHAAAGHTSPGASTGYHHHYIGLCDLPDDAAGIGGLAEEHEDIRGRLVAFDDLLAGVSDGRIDNAPLILATLWLALHRERLRG